MKEALVKLLKIKSIVTVVMTISMVLLLTGVFNPSEEIMTLYATAYGSIITYFFTKNQTE